MNPRAVVPDALRDLAGRVLHPQDRVALHLTLSTLLMAAGGLIFWVLITRGVGLPAASVGRGYAIVALGTAVAVVAKGGLDTALVRHGPRASRGGARRQLATSVLLALAVAAPLTGALALLAPHVRILPALPSTGWGLVLAVAVLLAVTWLQDAYYLADRASHLTLARNATFAGARLLAPLLLLAVALPEPVALAWALALVASAGAGTLLARRLPPRSGEPVPRPVFLRTALRNVASSAADFLPGLLLAPMVLALLGPEAAAYFGMAWAVAHLLLQVSAAVGRSALVSLVHESPGRHAATVRRGVLQVVAVVAPLAVVAALLAPAVLGVFGPRYARLGGPPFLLLCASVAVVSPWHLYLGVLRAREEVLPLVVFPVVTVAALLLLVPPLALREGLVGVALAWFLANVPFGAWSAWRIRREMTEVNSHDATPDDDRRPHAG